MRILKLIFCATLLSCGTSFADAPVTQPTAPPLSGKLGNPIQLFNGKDLEGWTFFQAPPKPGETAKQMSDVWTVRDGLIHDAGNPFGYIRIPNPYKDFVLTVEQRHVSRGNSGVFVSITGPDKIWAHSLEIQTLNGSEGELRGVYNFHLIADPARTEARRIRAFAPKAEKPPGEWETIAVTLDHGNLYVTHNGVLENLCKYTEDMSGQIGLQAEGGEMEFRKVELRPIETP